MQYVLDVTEGITRRFVVDAVSFDEAVDKVYDRYLNDEVSFNEQEGENNLVFQDSTDDV